VTPTVPLRRLAMQWLAFALVLVLVPFVVGDPASRFLVIEVLLYAMLAVTWNVTLGIAGIANFAHMAFFAVGAYASAVATTRWGASPWLGLPFAALVGGASGALAFVPIVRLRGIYIALVTFVFSQVCFYVAVNQRSWTGGSTGLVGIEPFSLGSFSFFDYGRVGLYFLAAAVFLIMLIIVDLLHRSTYGRSLIGLRDNEDNAVARGIQPLRQWFIAFVISAAMAGVVGALYANLTGVVSPELFGFSYSSLVLSMVFLGGVGSVRGPILGAIVVTVLSDRLNAQGPWRAIAVSAVIVVVLLFLPNGVAGLLAGSRRRLLRRRPTDIGLGAESVSGGAT
jgi:branched-chain amino acid transport system permease protein